MRVSSRKHVPTYADHVEAMCAAHMAEILPAFDEFRPRKLPYAYFTDASLLKRKPLRIIAPELYRWHLDTARINELHLRKSNTHIIKRVVPLSQAQYSPEEIEFIKFSLHFQMAVGTEVWVVFTQDDNFLASNLVSENISVVKGRSIVASPKLYEVGAPLDISRDRRPSAVADAYDRFHTLPSRCDVFRLWYDTVSFSKRRGADIKGRFGDFLYTLQSGTCAISGQPLLPGSWAVDHIYPLGAGGNNTLINLQAVCVRANLAKGARIEAPRFSPSPDQLRRYGFEFDYYRALSDRERIVPGLGWNALHYLNLFAV